MELKEALLQVYNIVKNDNNHGEVAQYIPELANTNPENFGIHLSTIDGEQYGLGDYGEKFTIQSIAKVLSLSLAYKMLGEKTWERLGVEPSGTAFNSLVQLETDKGIPRNPFINSGALVICDILLSQLDDPMTSILEYCRNISGNVELDYSERVANSEKKHGHRNIALCNFIKSFGNIMNEPEEVLDFYFRLCSIQMSCQDMSQTFLYLANGGKPFARQEPVLNTSQTKRINAVMQTCGFYDESGDFSFKVGLPGKSGVSGGIIAIHPGKYSIAVWSPRLNAKGNSQRGMAFLEAFTTKTQLSIF